MESAYGKDFFMGDGGATICAHANMQHMRAIVSECIGTALLVAAVVGSGIMGERLSGGNMALALLANSIATGAVLVTLIFTFAPISGAHFNPAVSLATAFEGGSAWRRVPGYVVAQFMGWR